MSNFERLWEGGPLFAQAEHFRLGTDCVLLADFAYKVGTRRGIDLGCASGSIMLLMLANNEKIHMTGLEILPEAAALAEENMSVNAFSDRSRIVTGDIRRHRELFRSGEFDFVVANAREVFGLTTRNRINKGFPGHTPLFLCPEIRAVRHRMAA